jgi:predicted transcriptional regulator
MVTLTFKATRKLKTRLARAARERKISVSALIRSSVEKEVPESQRRFQLGACYEPGMPQSTYDPEAPAFAEDEWEQL